MLKNKKQIAFRTYNIMILKKQMAIKLSSFSLYNIIFIIQKN